MIDKDSLPLDKPRRTPDHPTKSHVVKTRVDGKEKIIRFGEQGAKTAGKPKEGESEAMKQKRASFKARHAKNIAKGKSSPAYWADKVKWATGGSVDLKDLDEKYEGIKKPDFTLLESFRQLISDLQARAEESGTQEFDPLRALGRSGAAESLEDLYASYADKPRESHARRAEAGAEPVTEADMGGISPAAQEALAALRASWSGPEFDVISSYRDPERNKRVGGAKGSQHLHGNAFDINTAGWTPEEKLALADAAYDAGFRGFGFYNNNLHFDVASPRAWGPSYKRESVPLWAQDWVAQRFNEGGRVKRDPEMTEAELIEGMFKSEDGIDRLNDYMRKISRAGTVGKQAGRLTGIPFGGNIGRLIAEAIAEEQFSQEQGYAEGGLAELAHKYDKGGKKKDDNPYDILNLEPDAFVGALDELGMQGEERKFLMDQYFAKNRALPMTDRPEGKTVRAILPIATPEGMSGYEALMSGDFEFAVPEILRGIYEAPAEAINVASAIGRGVPVTEAQVQEAGMVVPEFMAGVAPARALTVGGGRIGALEYDPTVTRAFTGPGKGPSKIPDLRTLPVEEAVRIAKREPHLIESGNRSEGLYVGGPRTIQSKRDLNRMRRELDAYIAADPRGGDWYDRYRAGVNEVTGGDPVDNYWMTNLEGQYSAGVSPEGELGFALKDTNSMIATGDPGKPARPAQAEASRRAAATGNPDDFQLGPKTGEYAKRVDPSRQSLETATGVNDFRHLRNLGYTEVGGEAQRNAVGAAGHRFADYETALAVGRANKAGLAGRSNWTGEQLQAAPWVRQKALDLLERGRAPYEAKATSMLRSLGQDATPERVGEMAYELAFQDANKTIADFFPKHTAFATHEAQPYRYGDHLSGLADAPSDVKSAFAADPRSTWAIAPGGRDAIYSGLRFGDTGYAMRVRPTVGMQGVYEAPGGMLEYNMGEVARPLVSFDSGKVKTISAPDRALLDMSEALRGYVDYQGATPWHKVWVGGQPGMSNSVFATRSASSPATPEDIIKLRELGAKYGLPDVIDTGDGVTFTNFADDSFNLDSKAYKALNREIDKLGGFKSTDRAKIDSGYPGYEGTWEAGMGSGAATRQFLTYADAAPSQALKALDANPLIAKAALNRLERDADYAQQWGVAREDLQNARRIIGEGPGFVNRLRKALASGAVLPGVAAALLAPQMQDEESAQ